MLREVNLSTRRDLSIYWPYAQNNPKKVEHCRDCSYWAQCKNYDCPGTVYETNPGSQRPTCFSHLHSTK